MARLLFEFRCSNHHITEEFIDTKVMETECSVCGEPAHRRVSKGRIDPKMGLSNDFPTMADKWANMATRRHRGQMKDANNSQSSGE